jgi:2-polyprenyl-6-hydroxyphenyl methylase/3-demethylubiquinone-9 3-methyltransferase
MRQNGHNESKATESIMSTTTERNVDPHEVNKFEELAHRWWDRKGEFRPLHDLNPIRMDYIDQHCGGLEGKTVIDVGCGGGILSESMYFTGARVTGIDAAGAALSVAKLHQLESNAEVEYIAITAEELAEQRAGQYDVVTCMEMLEHVPDPASVIAACKTLVKPGGTVFFSTINRNPKSWLFAIVGAEYVLKLLPKGTHDYRKLIRPSEMSAWCRAAGLEMTDLIGLQYNPFNKLFALSARDLSVNYMATTTRPTE